MVSLYHSQRPQKSDNLSSVNNDKSVQLVTVTDIQFRMFTIIIIFLPCTACKSHQLTSTNLHVWMHCLLWLGSQTNHTKLHCLYVRYICWVYVGVGSHTDYPRYSITHGNVWVNIRHGSYYSIYASRRSYWRRSRMFIASSLCTTLWP